MSGEDAANWRPMAEERDDAISAHAAAALHCLFDAPGAPPKEGDLLPPLWHWLAFLPDAPQRELGFDGHPRTGTFLPPSRLPRRMLASGRLDFLSEITIGASVHRHSTVTSSAEKLGRSGELKFVDVTNELTRDGRAAIVEVQSIVYRETAGTGASQAFAPIRRGDELEEEWPWQLELGTDPILLFRFSALTYNAHRIHYDRDYATSVEGYPGLVVHGPLQAVGLAELCRRNVTDRRMIEFSFRALRPAFDGAPLRLGGRWRDQDHVELVAVDQDGQHTMTGEAAFD